MIFMLTFCLYINHSNKKKSSVECVLISLTALPKCIRTTSRQRYFSGKSTFKFQGMNFESRSTLCNQSWKSWLGLKKNFVGGINFNEVVASTACVKVTL